MINVVKKELEYDDDELKNNIEYICEFYNTTPTIINSNIRKIDRIYYGKVKDKYKQLEIW